MSALGRRDTQHKDSPVAAAAKKLGLEELKDKAKAIRRSIIKITTEAGSGHPSSSLSATDVVTALFFGGYVRLDPKDPHFDAKSKKEEPTWFMVDLKAREKFPRPLTLGELREVKGLEKMVLLQKGSRLSVQPVTEREWEIICRAAGVGAK